MTFNQDYDVTTDPIYKNYILTNQIHKPRTLKGYRVALTQYCQHHQQSLTELIREAKTEQNSINNITDRQIYTKLLSFYQYLQTLGNKPITIKPKMARVRAIYSSQYIQLPQNIKIKVEKKRPSRDELITQDHIRGAVESRKLFKHKAIITVLSSSGMRSQDLRFLRVKDFIRATEDYHNSDNIIRVIAELSKQKDVVPCWEFYSKKTDEHTITFSSPESVEFTLTYLRQRLQKQGTIGLDEYLYPGYYKDKPMGASSFISIFEYINNDLGLGLQSNNYGVFHAHGLREFFATTLNTHGVNYTIFKKMMGHTLSGVDQAYVNLNDRNVLRKEYLRVLPYLSIRDVRVRDVDSKEFIRLKVEADEQAEQIRVLEERDRMREEQLRRVLEELEK